MKKLAGRFALAWHVLRGRPLAYKLDVIDGALTFPFPPDSRKSKVIDCTFRGGEVCIQFVSPSDPRWSTPPKLTTT